MLAAPKDELNGPREARLSLNAALKMLAAPKDESAENGKGDQDKEPEQRHLRLPFVEADGSKRLERSAWLP